jgi:hypothetical protein
MAKKMKKYFGERRWSETPYYWIMDEEDIEWLKECEEIDASNKLIGDADFFLLEPPFGDADKNSTMEFDAYHTMFDDTNWFITDTEVFNWYKKRRI